MSSMGGDTILEMNERSKNNMIDEGNEEVAQNQQISRFIISPNNYWNMQWNNCTQIIFVIYIFVGPMQIV